MDWEQVESDAGRSLLAFVTHCIAVRAERPTLHAAHFYTGETEILPGLLHTDWFDESGTPMDQENWDYAEGRLLALRRVARAEHKRGAEGEVSATLLLVNAHSEDREFVLPEPHLDWIVLFDAAETPDKSAGGSTVRKPRKPEGGRITVASHSAMLLV